MNNKRRREFLKSAGASLLLASTAAADPQEAKPESIAHAGAPRPLTEKEKLARIASNTWPIRYIFKSRSHWGDEKTSQEMKKKYGEITMLDFQGIPEF